MIFFPLWLLLEDYKCKTFLLQSCIKKNTPVISITSKKKKKKQTKDKKKKTNNTGL